MTTGNRPAGSNPTGQHGGGGGMTTNERVKKDLADLLNRVIRLEFDVGQAYETALHRLGSEEMRNVLKDQEADHGGHIEQLSKRVEALGHKAADRADYYSILEKARVVLGDVAGDHGILSAMKANLNELRDTLKAALDSEGFLADDKAVLEHAYLESDRHVRELEALATKAS